MGNAASAPLFIRASAYHDVPHYLLLVVPNGGSLTELYTDLATRDK